MAKGGAKSGVKRGGVRASAGASASALKRLDEAQAATPTSGVMSEAQRLRLLADTVERLRVGAGRRGGKSTAWQLGVGVVFALAQRVLIGGEAVSVVVASAASPCRTARVNDKRLAELLGVIRAEYLKLYHERSRTMAEAKSVDEFDGDLGRLATRLVFLAGLRVAEDLDVESWPLKSTSDRHLSVRMMELVVSGAEAQTKGKKAEADARHKEAQIQALSRRLKGRHDQVSPEQLSAMLECIMGGDTAEQAYAKALGVEAETENGGEA